MDFVYEVTTTKRSAGPSEVTTVEIGNCERCLQAGENGQLCRNCQTQWYKPMVVDDDHGRRNVWAVYHASELDRDDLRQFKDSRYKLAMTSYG